MTTAIDSPIAERRLLVVGDPSRIVTVTIGQPRPDSDPSGDWVCPIVIQGLAASPQHELVHGIDGIQALLLAVERARSLLDASGLVLTMARGEPGETGFPRTVPSFYGRDFARKLEGIIDREVDAFARAAEVGAKPQA